MASNGTSTLRRLLSLLLTAALCVALAGCGPADGPAATPTPKPTQSPAAAAPTPGEATTATPAPEATATPAPSPTESSGEERPPVSTPEATPEPSAPVSNATPVPTQSSTAEPTAPPTPTPSEEPSPLPCNVPDATALEAAGWKAGDKIFTSGVTAEEFLSQVNETIAKWELIFSDTYDTNGPSDKFNWHTQVIGLDGLTVLEQVKFEVLNAFNAVSRDTWTDLYKNFDIQVYYAQLIGLLGQPLPWGSPNYQGPAPTVVA